MNDLEALFPERHIRIGETLVEVKPFRFGHFKKVLEIVERYANVFASEPNDWVKALLVNGEDAIEALATLTLFCVDRDREWLDELEGEDALDLFFKVFEVNADFFVRRITAGATSIATAIQKAGQSSSPDLSPQATTGAKSKTIAKAS
jgi:hypothetical protein